MVLSGTGRSRSECRLIYDGANYFQQLITVIIETMPETLPFFFNAVFVKSFFATATAIACCPRRGHLHPLPSLFSFLNGCL
jgi:hypothetical protein